MNYTETILKKAAARLNGAGGKIIAGFSGGADSTALLSVLIKTVGAEALIAVHINHMLRGDDADADESFCREFCKNHGVEFICRKINVRALCGDSAVEETARDCRYKAFSEIASENGAEYIALAHTASDNLETVLFNLCRGSGLSGMRGIPFSRPCGKAMIIRPLIDCTREEIIGYDDENGLSFVTDKTNSDIHYTRNFIRAEIVPKLKEIFPSAERSVVNMSDSISLDYDLIRALALDFIKNNAENGTVPTEKLRELHPALLRRVVSELYVGTLDKLHVCLICDMISAGSDGRIAVSGKLFATVRNGVFGFSEDIGCERRPDFEMKLAFGENLDPLSFCICAESGSAPDGYTLVGEASVPEELFPELYVRSRRAGDKYYFYNMTRTIKKMLSHIPENAKKIRPVFCIGDKVVWYPGFPPARLACDGGKNIKIKYYEKSTEVNENV